MNPFRLARAKSGMLNVQDGLPEKA